MADYPSLPMEFPFGEGAKKFVTVRSDFEQEGYSQTRAKVTVAPRSFTFFHRTLPAADVATWQSFWDSVKGGADSFNFTDPRTTAVVVCKFLEDEMPVEELVQRTGPQTYDIGPIKLREQL